MAGTTTSIRQSCDRCRGQKLRCERDEERDTGACTRCIRLGTQCVYSHSLPKGRPNQYLPLAGSGSGGESNGCSGALGNVRLTAAAKRKAGVSIGREGSRRTSRGDGATNMATGLDTANSQPQPQIGRNGANAGGEDSGTIDPLLVSASSSSMSFTTAPTLPWLGNWSWTDSMLDDQMEGLSALVEESSGVPMQSSLFDEQLTTLPDWDAAHTRDKTGPEDASQGLSHVLERQPCLDTDMRKSRNDSGGHNDMTPASDGKGPGTALAQLRQLSMRLHPLHSKSQTLAENTFGEVNWKSKQALVVDKDVFGTLMSPLIHDACSSASGSDLGLESPEPANLGGILQEAMYATHQLLDTMSQLQQQQQRSKGGSPPTPVATPNSARSSKTGGQSSSPVVRHLISSCHGMLISVYTAVFEVLQRDADWHMPTRRNELGLSHGPLDDARLVVIVQLCAYLVYRQQAAVNAYIAPGSRPNTDAAERDAGNTAANELEGEMRLGLDRLRTALSIP